MDQLFALISGNGANKLHVLGVLKLGSGTGENTAVVYSEVYTILPQFA